jgi:hypothetical protein
MTKFAKSITLVLTKMGDKYDDETLPHIIKRKHPKKRRVKKHGARTKV